MQRWLPKLVGVEESLRLEIIQAEEGSAPAVIQGKTEATHAAQLTRAGVTAAVHFVYFEFAPEQVELFRTGNVVLAVEHPAYPERTELPAATKASLLRDLDR